MSASEHAPSIDDYFLAFEEQLKAQGIVARKYRSRSPADASLKMPASEKDVVLLAREYTHDYEQRMYAAHYPRLDAAIVGKLSARLVGKPYNATADLKKFAENLNVAATLEAERLPKEQIMILRTTTAEEVDELLDRAIDTAIGKQTAVEKYTLRRPSVFSELSREIQL